MGTVSVDSTTVNIQVGAEGTYNVMVIGTRKDQIMIDFFDNNGGVEYISQSPDPNADVATPMSVDASGNSISS